MMLILQGTQGHFHSSFGMDIISSKVSLPFILLLNKIITASIVVITTAGIMHQFGSLSENNKLILSVINTAL